MFDLIILGGGPGGYRAAELAGKYGLKTALIEKKQLGGTCLNKGCIPLKGYLHLAHMINTAKELQKDNIFQGLNVNNINQSNIVKRNQFVIDNLQQGIEHKLKNAGVTLYNGNAKILSVNEEEVVVAVNDLRVSARYLIVAVGSQEIRLPFAHKELSYSVIYSDEMLSLQYIPNKVVIVGAGVIGLEAASYFNAVGCEVTLIDSAAEIGSGLDTEIANSLRKILEQKGIKIHTNAKVKEFRENDICIEKNGESFNISTETVLIAVGRIPFVEGLGLEENDIYYDKNGIVIDDVCRTNKCNVFACGDVTGKVLLAHTAYEQARIAVENIRGIKVSMNYMLLPRIIYTSPEVMEVGLSEKECIEKNISYIVGELPMTYSGKYYVEHKKDGAKAKILVDASTKAVIGFSMIGDGASEIALAVEMMVANKTKIEDVTKLIFPHPTVGEILRELAETVCVNWNV